MVKKLLGGHYLHS